MKKPYSLLFVLWLVMMAPRLVSGYPTNVWPFVSPSQYVVSDPAKVEVADGVARLKLQAATTSHTSVPDYTTNTTEQSGLGMGPDIAISIAKSGTQYNATGEYESRVFDGGEGNVWNGLLSQVRDRGAELSASELGLVALYHFNNSARDEVTGSDGTLVPAGYPAIAPAYTNRSMFGQYAIRCNPGYFRTVNPTLLQGCSEFAISFWIYPLAYISYAGLVWMNSSSTYFGVENDGTGKRLLFYAYTTSGVNVLTSTTDLGLNAWCHVVAVRTATGKQTLYVNGVLNVEGQFTPGNLRQDQCLAVGSDEYRPNDRLFRGVIDEVAIFNRALTSAEIGYLMRTSPKAGFRLRSGASPFLSGDYVGPDGTASSFYYDPFVALTATGAFNPMDRYAQYKVSMWRGLSSTPVVDAIRLSSALTDVLDDTWGDFMRGNYAGVANVPSSQGTPYVRLVKAPNGGVKTQGTYTSRILDAGGAVIWNKIGWDVGQQLASSLTGMEGLWHMNQDWGDASGKGHLGIPAGAGGALFTPYAKVGTYSAVFNGQDSTVSIGDMGAAISTVEWWMKPSRQDCGVMQLSSQVWFAVSNNMVVGTGVAGSRIYVNGRQQPALASGWNHVAVVLAAPVTSTAVLLGQAGGSYFEGYMDEMAMYSRALPQLDILEHYGSGRRGVAGQTRFQARADNNNPPQTAFVGGNDTTESYFLDPAGSTLPTSFIGKRYFQYRAYLAGDGTASPALDSVTVQYGGTSLKLDDTREEFSQGAFDSGSTEWAGDTITREALVGIGPSLINPQSSSQLLALWHMDDTAWVINSATVQDSSGNGRHGTPVGAVTLSAESKLGTGAGSFGTNGYITAAGGDIGTGDFSFSVWMNSTATNFCGLASTYGSATTPYYAVELNPASASAGSVAFALSDGSQVYRAISLNGGLNNGVWHHVSGVKQGRRIYVYVDGIFRGGAVLPSATINLGSALVYLGKYGTQNIFYKGMMDEVAIFGRALSGQEISELAANGYNARGSGIYTGPVMDAGQVTYWERMSWTEDAPFGKAHKAEPGSIVGLWHLNAISNNVTSDESGNGYDGTVEGGANLSSSGRFGACLSFNGSGQHVRIPDAPELALATFSWEAWINLSNEVNTVVVDKSNAGTGCRLGTDSVGRPYFQVGSSVCKAPTTLRVQQWNHLAGVYDATNVLLYVNGMLWGKVPAGGTPSAAVDALIGGSGLVDEVVLYNRPLNDEEVLDHYRAGVNFLGFQARSWSSGQPTNFVGPDGTANTYFTEPASTVLTSVIPLNQYFQYRAVLFTEDATLAPVLRGIQVSASAYPSDNPWVAPADGYGRQFFGNLISFMHVLATNNNDSEVKYQISGNNGSNWYAWVDSQWTDVTPYTDPVSSWNMSSAKDVIHANIGSFYDQLYAKTGGVFKFKAFLKSDAIKQVSLDEVRLGYSAGRVVVTVPNGLEVGNEAWLEGVPYTIRWTSAGTVSSKLKLEYTLNSGQTWSLIATNVANVAGTNSYSYWTTPPSVSDTCRVRITDMLDPTISDTSDSDFSIVERFRVVKPNGGEKWLIGRSNAVVWASALNLGLLKIDYAADGSNYAYSVAFGLQNTPGSASNQYVWATPLGNPGLLSENGRIRIGTLVGQGSDESDAPFTLAGVEITNPQVGSAVKRGGPLNIRWVSAGAGAAVGIDFSADGGTLWTNVVPTAANVLGSNVYTWVAQAPPSDNARLRVRSLSDTNVVGLSAVFTLADIDVTAPSAGTNWLMSTTNTIRWTSGGAGDKVNIYWSIDGGATWTPIVANYTNASGPNSYNWVAHRFPSATAKIKVESVLDPENLWAASADYNHAGVRVSNPNGNETWVKDVQNAVQWTYQSIGQKCTIQFSYDGGLSYTNVGGPGVGLSDRAYIYTPIKPTVRAKAKVIADDPSPYTNVFDESDFFATVAGISVTTPSGGMSFTIGTANTIAWTSAGSEDPLNQARLYYSAGAETNLITTVGNNQAYPGGNTFLWNILPGVTPNASAKIIVKSGDYTGVSDPFILRGIKFTAPAMGAVYDVGGNGPVAWVYAGLDASAVGYFYLSTDGGKTFSGTPINETLNWSVQAGAYPWVISPDTTPTTNAVLKFKVTASTRPEDVGFEALSQTFTIRGFKVVTPNAGTAWALGQTNQIVWLSALGGTYASLYYAANGVTYDMARPIVLNVTPVEGSNSYSWGIESFRLPSTNARVKVVSTVASAESALFRLNGLRVTAPIASDVWAKDETNRITWAAVGAVAPYTVSLIKDGATVLPIASGVGTPYYDWAIPPEAVSSNVYVRVQDSSGLSGRSDTFRIVGEPTIGILSPAPGEFLKVSQIYAIQWSKGGKMENDFKVQYSTEPFLVTNEIYGVVTLDTTNNLYSIPWTVPDRLGATIIIIQNNVRPTVQDVSAPFYVVGMFTVLSPNGGETSIYALKPTTLSWFTRGTVPEVNLYYSTAPLHGPESWVKINSTPVPNNGGGLGDQLTTYDWIAVNLESSTARIRVEQADRPGAYDDSDADFAIRYYEILWHVFDNASSNNLDSLSVSDSSGWSESDLTSPVVHRYPYGTYDSVWSRQYFYNNVIFKWNAEPSRTIDVPMNRSEVEPNYNVMANFVYDATNGLFRVTSWLEQQGQVVTTAAKSTVSVFDSSGVSVAQVVVLSPDANGIFWASLPTTLNRGAVYYAKVEIELSGVVYSSGVTFNLRVPTEQEQAQQMMNALTNIQDIVSRVDTNLTDLATAQALFRQSTAAKLDSLTNSAEVIKAGLTNLDLKLDGLSTQTLARLDILTNTIGVIGPGETNVVSMLRSLVSGGATREARILTRPTSVKLGSVVSVLYRSKEGLTVSYQVLNAIGAVVGSGSMTGAGGIYEAALTANWGLGDYQIICSDNAGSSDRMILKVTAIDIDDLALTMGSISGQLGRVEGSLTNMMVMVSNVNSTVGTLGALTNMVTQVEILTNSLSKITALTNMSAQLSYMTNVIDKVGVVTNLGPSLGVMTNMLAGLGPLTNFGPQMAYMTNIVSKLTTMTNIGDQVSAMTSAVGRVAAVTNLIPQMAYLTNAIGPLAGLTNMPAKLDSVVVAIGQLGSLTNLGTQVSALSASLDRILALTNMASQMDTVAAAVGSLGSLTNLGPQVDALSASLDKIIALTNMASQMDSVAAAVGQLGSLTNLGGQVAALSGSLDQIMALTNMAGQVNTLTATLNGMTNLTGKVDQLAGTLGQIALVTNMVGTLDSVQAAIGQLGGLTNLGPQVAALSASLDQIIALTNVAGQISGVATTLNGMTNLNWKVDQLAGALTNMPTQLDGVVAAIGQLGSLTNLGPQVDALSGAMSDILALTNVAGQVADVAAAVAQLGVVTNMAGQVNGLVTSMAGLNSATLTISNTLAALVSSLGSLQSMSNSLSAVSALQGDLATMSAMSSNIYDTLEFKIGAEGDPATADTVFGRLAAIEQSVTAVGGQTASAISKASGARSQASSAASAVQRIKQEMGTGKMSQVATDVAEIRRSLGSAMAQIQSIPGEMSTEGLVKSLREAMGKIDEVAKSRGLQPLGQPTEELKAGLLSDPQAVAKLLNTISETKAMMDAMRVLMDDAVNKPVVVEWMEGEK